MGSNGDVLLSALIEERRRYNEIRSRRKYSYPEKFLLDRWEDAFGAMKALAVSRAMVTKEMDAMELEGYSRGSVNLFLAAGKALYNRAVYDEILPFSPIAKVRRLKHHNQIVRCLSEPQERQLLEALNPYLRPIVLVALQTGMRRSEYLGLRWADVNFETGVITLGKTKSGEIKYIPMNSRVLGILAELKTRTESAWVFPAGKRNFMPGCKVFTGDQPIGGENFRNFFVRAVRKAGVGPFRVHDLRHTFASRLAMAGCSELMIAELLCHSKKAPELVRRYAHLIGRSRWEAVEKIVSHPEEVNIGSLRGFLVTG